MAKHKSSLKRLSKKSLYTKALDGFIDHLVYGGPLLEDSSQGFVTPAVEKAVRKKLIEDFTTLKEGSSHGPYG